MKSDTSLFLREVYTAEHLSYTQLTSLYSQRMLSSSSGGVHDGMVTILPGLDGWMKEDAERQAYRSLGRTISR